jgi:DNA (cytosine-5)-methyltransferase 1
MTPRGVLETAYAEAFRADTPIIELSPQQREWAEAIVQKAESQKAVLAATLTSLVKKIVTPDQDIRLHKVEMPGGYSGRSFDTQHVTTFLHEKMPRLAMKSGSGWLTRSIEQNHAFGLNFTGKIQDEVVKNAFLQLLNDVEENNADASSYLREVFVLLLRHAQAADIVFAPTPNAGQVTIQSVIKALHQHFFTKYVGAGASRLPVLAIYSVYAVSMKDEEYADKRLLPLKSHTTSDTKSSSLGDVEITDVQDNFFEAIEIKHDISITPTLVEDAYAKFQQLPLERYYLLTTASPNSVEEQTIEKLISQIRREHGCEVIVNGVLPTIQYYLRRGKRTAAFLEAYTTVMQEDFAANTDLKETHLRRWNEILTELNAENDNA